MCVVALLTTTQCRATQQTAAILSQVRLPLTYPLCHPSRGGADSFFFVGFDILMLHIFGHTYVRVHVSALSAVSANNRYYFAAVVVIRSRRHAQCLEDEVIIM